MVPSVVWLISALCSKSIFSVVPFTCYSSHLLVSASCSQNEHFGWFPLLFMVPSVVWLQNVFQSKVIFWVVQFTFYGSQCCLAPMCFRSKLIFFSLFMVLCVVWFPVSFSSNMFSTQNQHFRWFPSLFVVPSVVWLQSALCSPCGTVEF